jgi:hypothetical protein
MTTTTALDVMAVTRARLNAGLRLTDAVYSAAADRSLSDLDFQAPLYGFTWYYVEPFDLFGASDEARRDAALAWLRTHAKLIRATARQFGVTTLDKVANDSEYGVRAYVDVDGTTIALHAQVPSSLTCEMVDTGEVEHVEAHDRPIVERRCPESIFAGIESEVAS